LGDCDGGIYYTTGIHSIWYTQNSGLFTMRLTQEVIDKIAVLMQHTKMNGETNWKDGDEIDVCLGGHFAGDKFISIINRTRSNTTKQ
tara:strand:+ start:234 stop:494 length:261 start_codon:yes stop_codon:yes gene_type:complete